VTYPRYAMERDDIERNDFPPAARGYDPAAVDAHLRSVADELDRRPPVEHMEDAAKGMLEKLDRLQGELDRLLGGLKATADTLSDTLGELSRDADTLSAAMAPSGPPSSGARSDDEAGARLVALNMALEGAPRAETGRFLAEHYELRDLEALLDDVYASAGK
jgi:DivIVA domain-containing protein